MWPAPLERAGQNVHGDAPQMAALASHEIASPTPLHMALDRLTVAMIEVQRLQRLQEHGEGPTGARLAESLSEIDRQLHDLGAILTALQHEARPLAER